MTEPQHEPTREPVPEPATDPGAPTTGPESTPEPTQREQRKDPLRGSRTSGAWTAVVVASVVLILLIVFIAQNTQSVSIAFFGWDGTAPLSVALLIATVAGVVVTAVIGTLRIWQLRRRVRRERHSSGQ